MEFITIDKNGEVVDRPKCGLASTISWSRLLRRLEETSEFLDYDGKKTLPVKMTIGKYGIDFWYD